MESEINMIYSLFIKNVNIHFSHRKKSQKRNYKMYLDKNITTCGRLLFKFQNVIDKKMEKIIFHGIIYLIENVIKLIMIRLIVCFIIEINKKE